MKLNVCMFLPGQYEPGMPTRPAVLEIYGNWLPRLGHDVAWIMMAGDSGTGVQAVFFADVPIYTVPCRRRSFLPGRILAKLAFLRRERRLAARIVEAEGCNIIQARNNIAEGLFAIWLKRRFRIPFVFQYSFPLAEAAFHRYRLGNGRIFYLRARLERAMAAFIMKRADLVLPISERMLEDLAKEGIPRHKMMPLPLAVNPDLFSPSVSGEEVRTKYHLTGSSVLLYLGTLDKLRQLDILLYMLAQLRKSGQGVKLLLVGEGDDRSRLESLAAGLGLADAVIFTGQVPYFEVPQFIAAADVTLSPVPPLAIYKVSSPCKLFEYMGVGKPVVANEEIPEHKEVLQQSGGGILVPFAAGAFASAVIELLDDPARAVDMGSRGREWVVKNRTYEILARRVEERYLELLHEKP